jgi:hypothetical protein
MAARRSIARSGENAGSVVLNSSKNVIYWHLSQVPCIFPRSRPHLFEATECAAGEIKLSIHSHSCFLLNA